MRSAAELRVIVERTLRVIAWIALGALVIDALVPPSGDVARVSSRDLPSALERWSTVDLPSAIHVAVDAPLGAPQRDWLAALDANGARVSWDGASLTPLAAVADPMADPAGGTRVLVAAPRNARLTIGDAHGVLDSATASAAGLRLVLPSAPLEVRVVSAGMAARPLVTDSLLLGRVLVLGTLGWESKFVAAALEERGWSVDLRLAIAPRTDVRQGAVPAIDERYAAVVALDSSAGRDGAAIARYVRAGGGLVLAPSAADVPAFTSLRPGRALEPRRGTEPFDPAAEPRRQLALTPIALVAGGVAMERRDTAVAVAARRVERGRVIAVGYEDTWRWRLGGGDDAVAAHRDWWSGLVAAVARTTPRPRTTSAQPDEAPYVRMFERLGAPSALSERELPWRPPKAVLFTILVGALLTEWALRRLRGLP
jgi:hypothetical protein